MTNAERYVKAAERAESQRAWHDAARYWDEAASEGQGEFTTDRVAACRELATVARKQAAGNTRADVLAVL